MMKVFFLRWLIGMMGGLAIGLSFAASLLR